MKKAAALIIAFCLVMVAAAPVVVKAAAGDLYLISKVGNGADSEIDLGNYLSNYYNYMIDGSSVGIVQQIISKYNFDSDCYHFIYNNGVGFDTSSSWNEHLFLVEIPKEVFKFHFLGWSNRNDFVNAGSTADLDNLRWNGTFNIMIDPEEKNQDGTANQPSDCHSFYFNGESWIESSIYWDSHMWGFSIEGRLIYTDCGSFLLGDQGAYIMYHDNIESRWSALALCDNYLDKFRFTKDGVNTDSYDDAFGSDVDFTLDQSLALSSIDMIPMKDNYVGGMTAAKVNGAFDFNTFDITFGGDQVKEAAAKSSYGLQFDVTVSYRVDTSYDKAVFQSLFGESYTGSIHSSFYIDDLTEENARNFDVSMTLSDLLENSDSIVTGSKQGLALLALINYANEGERGSKTADFLGFGGMTLEDDAIVEETIGSVPLIGGIEESIRNWVSAEYTYGLTDLYYYASVIPYNSGVGVEGVVSTCECDMITGVHTGTAGGGTKTDPETGETVVNPNYTIGPDQSYLLPTVLPNGGNGEIVVSGSPSNSSANAQGGDANVTVNANPVINFQNGFEDFAKVMKLAENSNNVQKSFWGFFGVFKDNPAAELYRDYLGSFPEEFTKFILACCGICFGIGVYRFVRGRSV